MFNNKNLGVASGRGANIVGNRIVQDKQRDELPSGDARQWRKRCFEDTGGYLLTKSPDSVSNAKAIIKGWDTKQFKHIHALLKEVKLLFEKPSYTGFAYLYGYFGSLICRKEQTNDEEVKYYFRHIRLREIRRYYVNRLLKIFKIENTGDCHEILNPQ